MLSHLGQPAQLGKALAGYGRIFKTLHVLSYFDDEPYRREIKFLRNLQEGRHALAKHVFHGRRGELHQTYQEGMEDQLGALGLVVNSLTLWNTVYLDAIIKQLRQDGHKIDDDDAMRVSPYMRKHFNVHSHYSFQQTPSQARRPLRNVPKTTQPADS